MEPAHLRSQEIEKEYKKMRDLVTRLSKKLDAAEHQIEKIERKSSSQDELFQKVGVLDQNVKIHETRTSSELNNMNSNLELLKENMRRDTADVEENGKQIRKLHESINQLYEQILDAKKDLANLGIMEPEIELHAFDTVYAFRRKLPEFLQLFIPSE